MISKFIRRSAPQPPSRPVDLTPPKVIPQVLFEDIKAETVEPRGPNEEPRSILHEGIKIIGNWSSDGHVDFGGTIEGTLSANKLVVSETGQITGDIKADTVEISGAVQGNIYAEHLVLRAGAIVKSDIYVKDLSIDLGATVDAKIHMA